IIYLWTWNLIYIVRKFVSESELDEIRKKRQEEWEKVRKPDDPEEAPEEEYDPRSLYERLQEQKDKKQEEYEEQFKFILIEKKKNIFMMLGSFRGS
uniref:Proteasome activator subunit 3 interacting protein 1 n=1 Tax=Sinocyclocheilus rhinocerous TaxID=307959 RepID=A0A673JEB3_9TELE